MDNLNKKLRQLIAFARTCASGSLERQQQLNQIYRLVMKSGKLWKERTPYYGDALQEMWEYCFRHLEEYDPNVKEVITWLDDELKKRLRRYRYAYQKQHERHITIQAKEEDESSNLVNALRASSDIQQVFDIWERTLEWVRADPDRVLCNTYFRKRPEINCQALFLLRFPDETSWSAIAQKFDLTPAEAKDLPKWYNRRCLPLLREFGVSQGYLETIAIS